MSEERDDMRSPYSRTALRALEQVLKQHHALMFVDPTTQALSVRRTQDSAEGGRGQTVASLGPAYA